MQMNFVIGRKREAAPSSIHQRASEAQAALDARMRGEPDPTVAKGQPWWYLLLAALFLFGVSGLAARGSIGIAILCGVAGLAALFAANKMRLKQRAAAKAKRTGAFSFAAKRPVQMPAWIIVLISVAPSRNGSARLSRKPGTTIHDWHYRIALPGRRPSWDVAATPDP